MLAADLSHQAANRVGRRRRGQQVHVVVLHQHLGVQPATGGNQRFVQEPAIAGPVFVVEEAGLAIIATLDNMLLDAGMVDAS